jgi:hypothetical protein
MFLIVIDFPDDSYISAITSKIAGGCTLVISFGGHPFVSCGTYTGRATPFLRKSLKEAHFNYILSTI